jgi:methanethiol S-methyltransferase
MSTAQTEPERSGSSRMARLAERFAAGFAGLSLIVYALFLCLGGFDLLAWRAVPAWRLIFDGGLSLLFFLQHSGMVRQSFRRQATRAIPAACLPALYDLASGITLLLVLSLWQGPLIPLVSAHGVTRWCLRGVFCAGLALTFWAGMVMLEPSAAARRRLGSPKAEAPPAPLCLLGPYRYVRHPLYLANLLLIWSGPDLTADRLLFNVMWSAWILIGIRLEERDLIAVHGQAYRDYRASVPVLLPWPR